jgi:amino-acid N-acetyltransferase
VLRTTAAPRRDHGEALNMPPEIQHARPADLDDVLALLREHHLPLDGLHEHVGTMLVARQDGRIVGSAALEIYPDGALLRSVAVAPAVQRHRVGRGLTEAAIRLAQDRRVPALYLLTTTAADYFPRFGFERVSRADVPAGVQQSIEFTSACPSTAVVMRMRLRD